MEPTLYFHPLASYCWKALIALYDSGIAFTPRVVDLGNADDRAALQALWPPARFPVLHDVAQGRVLPESTILIEYLAERHPGAAGLLPADAGERLDMRLWDRVCDDHLQDPMQKIVADRLRDATVRDPHGVAEARAALQRAYLLFERHLQGRTWLASAEFSLADCAALPALFYATILEPLPAAHAALHAYFERLLLRPSVRRVLDEAKPWLGLFPYREAVPARFL